MGGSMNQDTQDFIEDLEEENFTQSKFIAEVSTQKGASIKISGQVRKL